MAPREMRCLRHCLYDPWTTKCLFISSADKFEDLYGELDSRRWSLSQQLLKTLARRLCYRFLKDLQRRRVRPRDQHDACCERFDLHTYILTRQRIHSSGLMSKLRILECGRVSSDAAIATVGWTGLGTLRERHGLIAGPLDLDYAVAWNTFGQQVLRDCTRDTDSLGRATISCANHFLDRLCRVQVRTFLRDRRLLRYSHYCLANFCRSHGTVIPDLREQESRSQLGLVKFV